MTFVVSCSDARAGNEEYVTIRLSIQPHYQLAGVKILLVPIQMSFRLAYESGSLAAIPVRRKEAYV